jgi:NDP-sugar pyrophosphorylase family protein
MNSPHIVILAGGISSRMKKASTVSLDPSLKKEVESKSKTMLGLGHHCRPFLDYLLQNIQQAGYRNVVIVVGERDPSIRDYYEKGGKAQFPFLNISYTVQPIPDGRIKPLGTADALLRGLIAMPEWKGQQVTVCNSDNLYSVTSLQALLNDTHSNAMIDYDRSALNFEQSRIESFAVVKKNSDGFLLDIIEKPTADQIVSATDKNGRVGVSMNLFRFSYDMILPFLKTVPLHPVRQEKELPEAVRMMVAQYPTAMWTIPFSEHVIDLTSQADIPAVKEYLQKNFPQFQQQ